MKYKKPLMAFMLAVMLTTEALQIPVVAAESPFSETAIENFDVADKTKGESNNMSESENTNPDSNSPSDNEKAVTVSGEGVYETRDADSMQEIVGDSELSESEESDSFPAEDPADTINVTADSSDVDNTTTDNSELVSGEDNSVSYTLTLEANGGYFANEWDDILNGTVERADVLHKTVNAGEPLEVFPSYDAEDLSVVFGGWSLEPSGEVVTTESGIYYPSEDCTLFAIWILEENKADDFGNNADGTEGDGTEDRVSDAPQDEIDESTMVSEESEPSSEQYDLSPDFINIWKHDNQITIIYETSENISLGYTIFDDLSGASLYSGNLLRNEEEGFYYDTIHFDSLNESASLENLEDISAEENVDIKDIPVKVELSDGTTTINSVVSMDAGKIGTEIVKETQENTVTLSWECTEMPDGFAVCLVNDADEQLSKPLILSEPKLVLDVQPSGLPDLTICSFFINEDHTKRFGCATTFQGLLSVEEAVDETVDETADETPRDDSTEEALTTDIEEPPLSGNDSTENTPGKNMSKADDAASIPEKNSDKADNKATSKETASDLPEETISSDAMSSSSSVHNWTFNGHKYQRFEMNKTWKGAKRYCESLGGHLATITSLDEQTYIENLGLKPGFNYWIGATDEDEEDQWKWVTGEPWEYTLWDIGQPDNYQSINGIEENYLQIISDYDYKWNDSANEQDETAEIGFICEWDSEYGFVPPRHDALLEQKEAYDLYCSKLERVWSGEYDGLYDNIPVRRKYAISINSIDVNGNISGIAFVDKLENTMHPEMQVRGSYYFEGKIDAETGVLTFQGTELIEEIDDFEFVTFTISPDGSFSRLTGTTDAYDGSTVELTSASGVSLLDGFDYTKDSSVLFNYDENRPNPELALECMENSLLMYGDSADNGSGYYVRRQGKGLSVLKKKLKRQGLAITDKQITPAGSSDEDVPEDSASWIMAHRELTPDTELVYIIFEGTYKKQWLGDFNVAGPGDQFIKDTFIHYSFNYAANAAYNHYKSLEKDFENIDNKNIIYVVTGHSRGAAIANLVAKTLTDEKKAEDKIFAYTFATPTVVKESQIDKEYPNIFNYCLDDDFVTYIPLENSLWEYGRYGTTFHATAADLYSGNPYFRSYLNNYNQVESYSSLNYKENGAYNMASSMNAFCESVESYYERDKSTYRMPGDILTEVKHSWYDFFRNLFAPLLAGDMSCLLRASLYSSNLEFNTIMSQFLVGGTGYATGEYSAAAYLGNTHDPKSYYAWMLCYASDDSVASEYSSKRSQLAEKFTAKARSSKGTHMDPVNDVDASVLCSFAGLDENLEKLGWDLSDPLSWSGITWNENGRVSGIYLPALALTGELDISELTDLEELDCSSNQLSGLILGDVSLRYLSCEGNYLDIYKGSALHNRIKQLDRNGGFSGSYMPQCSKTQADYSESDLNALQSFANTDNNLELLGWDIDSPETYSGINWVLFDGQYYAESIELCDLGLTGSLSLADFPHLTVLSINHNNLDSIDFSNCVDLEWVDISYNELASIDYSGCNNLNTLICSYNCLDEDTVQTIKGTFEKELLLLETDSQKTSAEASLFDPVQLSILEDLLTGTNLSIDWNHPGLNDNLTWTLIDGKYEIKGLDLSESNMSGAVDLSGLDTLAKIDFRDTAITSIILPSSIQHIGDMAFWGCRHLENLYVSDHWSSVGTDTFKGCPGLTIHCMNGSFADFYCKAMNIAFEGEDALDSIYVEGDTPLTLYKGAPFSFGSAKLIARYSDGSVLDITDPSSGYLIKGFDSNQTGEQTIRIEYSDENYTCRVDVPVLVYAVSDGFVYDHIDDDCIQIVDYVGQERDLTIPSSISGESVTEIAKYAFEGKDISSVNIPETVTFIDDGAFKDCAGLTGVTFHEGLYEIGSDVFLNDSSLQEALLPDSIALMGESVFSGCSSLKKAHLPDSRVNINYRTFSDCINLTEINIPSTVQYIWEYAFDNCISLKEIILPEELEHVDEYAFHNVSGKIIFKGNIIEWCSIDISEDGNDILFKNIQFQESCSVSNLSVSLKPDKYTYNGEKKTPAVRVYYKNYDLKATEDYSVQYTNNINAGTATVTITGKGNYNGTKSTSFTINKAAQSITANNLSLTFPNSGKIIASGNTGSLSYKSSNTAIAMVDSTGKVTAKGAGKATITITAAATSNYNAASKTITVTVVRAAQSITAKSAASSVAVGKTTIVSITGAKGTKSFKSSDTTIATVTSAGKVTAKKVGTVKITATSAATAQYNAASRTVTIKVVPAATASLAAANQATGIKLTWKAVTGANGYKVYRGSTLIKTITSGSTVTYADTAANTNGTKYTYKVVAKASTGDSTLSKSVTVYRVARPAVSSVTNSAASKMTVKWGKNAKANGYEIQYSLSSSFASGNKAVTITNASTVSKVIGSLTKGKTYYVRIRTFKTVGSTKYWSEWSAKKSVKIAK